MAIRSLSAKLAPEPNTKNSVNASGTKLRARRRRLSRVARYVLALGCLGLTVAGSTGCTMTSGSCRALRDGQECLDDFMIGYRNRAMAEKAWHRHRACYGYKGCFNSRPFLREFKDGFIQGYMEVASGGNGCIPAIAPQEYWGWKYQTSHGHSAVNAWFEGFPLGVKAAEQDGVGHWQQISSGGFAPPAAPLAAPMAPAIRADGNPDVANPFYSEEEFLPVPEPDVEPSNEPGLDIEEIEIREPESVSNEAFPEFPLVQENDSELVSEFGIAESHEAAVAAKLHDGTMETQEVTDVVIEDIFGTAAEPTYTDSEELPFSFE